MKLKLVIILLSAAILTVLAACAGTPSAAASATAAPAAAATAAPADAAAPSAATGDAGNAASQPAASLVAPAKPFVFESFEKADSSNRPAFAWNDTQSWKNLCDEGWGGWKSRNLAVSVSTEHATEGKSSMLLTIDGKISAKGFTGACIGLNWNNDGAFPKDFVPNLTKIAYVAIDYTWETGAENTVSNPFLGINLIANGRDDSISKESTTSLVASKYYNILPGSGTIVIKYPELFKNGTTKVPQYFLKVYAAYVKGDEAKADPAEVGKKLQGKLWLDNIRYADANGNIFAAK